MATRSTIAIKEEDGKVKGIYCHWDGYINSNGKILMNHYSDVDKIRQLINIGDLSSLDKEIGEKHDFDKPPEGVCNFYSRDWEEENTDPIEAESLTDFYKKGGKEEYNYVYSVKDGQWYVDNAGEYDGKFRTLNQAFEELRKAEEEQNIDSFVP